MFHMEHFSVCFFIISNRNFDTYSFSKYSYIKKRAAPGVVQPHFFYQYYSPFSTVTSQYPSG
jgi:hypothetical protein